MVEVKVENLMDGNPGLSERKAAVDGTSAGPSLVSKVVDAILLGAKERRFAPGQRLIAADLAVDLNVSRAPVREALHILAGEGVVDLIPNRGAKLRTLSADEMVDIMEYTEAICALGVRLATAKMDHGDTRETIERYAEVVRDAWRSHDAARFVESLFEYHDGVHIVAGNAYLTMSWRRSTFRFFIHLLSAKLPGSHWDQYIFNYERIFETMLAGDTYAASCAF
ncbi:MAG: GntR family transcriptional regulator [Pseudomonadota bacterium]